MPPVASPAPRRCVRRAARAVLPPGALLLAVVLSPAAETRAQTLYVDVDASAACACKAPAKNGDAACGASEKPFACIGDALGSGRPWDTVLVRDGTYKERIGIVQGGAGDAQRRTIKAEHPGAVLIDSPKKEGSALYIHANFVTVQGLRITRGDVGLQIVGAKPGESDAGTGVVVEDVEVFGNGTGVLIQRGCTGLRLSRLDIHDNTPHDGLKLDTSYPGTMTDTILEDSHIHHNRNQGIGEGNAVRTVIRNCEVDHNGTDRLTHGFYMKGFEGLIQGCKVHDNSGYGIQLWAAPRGSAGRHYIVENNDVYANGSGGIVLGGTPAEAAPSPPLPPGDGLPHFVEIRGNRIHDNPSTGFVYYGSACDDVANDNSFHDNIVEDNGALAVQLSALRNDAGATRLVLKDNVFAGPPWTDGAALALFVNTSLDAGTFDGNTFFMPGADASTPLFRWQCRNCREPPAAETRYSFEQARDQGVPQDNTRRPELHCGAPAVFRLDARSRWADPHSGGDAAPGPPP